MNYSYGMRTGNIHCFMKDLKGVQMKLSGSKLNQKEVLFHSA